MATYQPSFDFLRGFVVVLDLTGTDIGYHGVLLSHSQKANHSPEPNLQDADLILLFLRGFELASNTCLELRVGANYRQAHRECARRSEPTEGVGATLLFGLLAR
jgi:hypothetical protein